MPRLTTAALPVLLAMLFGVHGVASFRSPAEGMQATGIRTLVYSPERPIPPQLRETDQTVLVKRELDYAVPTPTPTPTAMAQYLTWYSTITAIVSVRSIQPVLVEDQSWIDTRIQGTVRQLFKGSKLLRRDQSLDFLIDGGEMRIGQVLVRAGEPALITPRSSLLVFLERLPDGTLLSSYDPVMILNDTMRSVSHPERQKSRQLTPLFGQSFSGVVNGIRAAAARPNPK